MAPELVLVESCITLAALEQDLHPRPTFPPPKCDPRIIPNFVCEACQVRVFLSRELFQRPPDVKLLMLERMRQLDMLHKWAAANFWLASFTWACAALASS